ncbi:MAG: helix-turn-helix domain-containing protein [Candidatus Omnitrophica bacterium]|nr:helix-turn-helix domain-containing protein [Candidatus Omnitrophota bacterium]
MRDKKILITFGKNVKKYRQARGLSQEQLAKKAGVHRTYIGGIESVGRNVSLINILRIAHALKVKIDVLVR